MSNGPYLFRNNNFSVLIPVVIRSLEYRALLKCQPLNSPYVKIAGRLPGLPAVFFKSVRLEASWIIVV